MRKIRFFRIEKYRFSSDKTWAYRAAVSFISSGGFTIHQAGTVTHQSSSEKLRDSL